MGGDSRGHGEGTKVKATKTSGGLGGTPVRHKIPLKIVIFLVVYDRPRSVLLIKK